MWTLNILISFLFLNDETLCPAPRAFFRKKLIFLWTYFNYHFPLYSENSLSCVGVVTFSKLQNVWIFVGGGGSCIQAQFPLKPVFSINFSVTPPLRKHWVAYISIFFLLTTSELSPSSYASLTGRSHDSDDEAANKEDIVEGFDEAGPQVGEQQHASLDVVITPSSPSFTFISHSSYMFLLIASMNIFVTNL